MSGAVPISQLNTREIECTCLLARKDRAGDRCFVFGDSSMCRIALN